MRPSAVFGFIMNIPSSSRWTSWMPSAIASQKHWIVIRKVGDDLYFNLDSHLDNPEPIGEVNQIGPISRVFFK